MFPNQLLEHTHFSLIKIRRLSPQGKNQVPIYFLFSGGGGGHHPFVFIKLICFHFANDTTS